MDNNFTDKIQEKLISLIQEFKPEKGRVRLDFKENDDNLWHIKIEVFDQGEKKSYQVNKTIKME